ncbi:MAG TPA: hypothetical protein VFQ22_13505 [Longimicrobiales bacterium]|nr:hypothetical protein [Longimicrobiales bacterium]
MPADLTLLLIGLAAVLACASLGGGLYEFSVVDPFWPRRPDLIVPSRGGISRKRFWIPAHTAFELTLIGSLVAAWSVPEVRGALLVALASHAAMRIWSAFDFIPRALAFERADPATVSEEAARSWTRRSRLRFPLDLVTCAATLAAFFRAAVLA